MKRAPDEGARMKHDPARTLRRNQTDHERKLWYILRSRRFHTHKFRRQQPIGPYVADFVCFERKLVIKLDGSQHAEPKNVGFDRARTAFLERQGFRVLRFWNLDFIRNRDGVLERIRLVLEEDPSPARGQAARTLSHKGRGG
jgi:very-short-patch-repair endonuclease